MTRIASFWMQVALRFWPGESRNWGRALAAELDSIHNPSEAARWVIGGTLLFARAVVSRFLAWLQVPVGARLNGCSLYPSAQLPHCSRLFSGVLVLGSVAILCLPQGRQALSAVNTSWRFTGPYNDHGDDLKLERIAHQAERESDARTLAFVGLALSGPTCCPLQEPPDVIRYVDHAVAIDPSLAWIYTGMVYTFPFPNGSERVARLKASDPENAVVYLLSADAVLRKRRLASAGQHWPTDLEVQASVENDAQWLHDMERAIRSQRFDAYSQNFFDLFRTFYRQNPSLEPSTYMTASRGGRNPNDFALSIYVSILLRRAEQARSIESFTASTDELKRVVQFEEQARRRAGRGPYFDGAAVQALRGLRVELARRGHAEEAAAVEAQLQEFYRRNCTVTFCTAPNRLGRLERKGLLFHGLVFALVLFSFLLLASLAILEFPIYKRWQLWRFVRTPACLIADLCPALLVLTCVGFLYSYQPFVRAFSAQLSQSASLADLDAISGTYSSLESIPWKIQFGLIDRVFNPVNVWFFATAVLVLLALFILVRGFFRTRPAKPSNKLGHNPSVT